MKIRDRMEADLERIKLREELEAAEAAAAEAGDSDSDSFSD